jgi:hypothetical protein
MIVSFSRNFIFFHNPKCAGSSFRAVIAEHHDDPFNFWGLHFAPYFRAELDFAHLRSWELIALFPQLAEVAANGNSLIFVRNPYLRFLSAFREYITRYHPEMGLETMGPEALRSFVEHFLPEITVSRILADPRFVHFSPQIWFIRHGMRDIVRHVVPVGPQPGFMHLALNMLGLPFAPIGWENPAPFSLLDALASPRIVAFIGQLYEQDLAYFRAEPRLFSLADIPAPDNNSVIGGYEVWRR